MNVQAGGGNRTFKRFEQANAAISYDPGPVCLHCATSVDGSDEQAWTHTLEHCAIANAIKHDSDTFCDYHYESGHDTALCPDLADVEATVSFGRSCEAEVADNELTTQ